MHWSDLLIIYLSCGAPFGVHYFLQKRDKTTVFGLFYRSCGVSLLWIAYAPYLLWRKNAAESITHKTFFKPDPEISLLGQQISVLQEQILQAFIELNSKTGLGLHFFTFRDVLERYAGLTLALKADENTVGESDFEIFRIAGRKKKELSLAGKCLAKRNSMRLKAHQSNAREDFFKQMADLANLSGARVLVNGSGRAPNIFALQELILELLELIDVKQISRAEEIFAIPKTGFEVGSNNKVNGFNKPQEVEVISCQPPQQALSAQPQLQSPPLQMSRTAD